MNLILASGSPRRYQLLKDAGLSFKVIISGIDEEVGNFLSPFKVAEYLAIKKGGSIPIQKKQVIIAADTVVILKNNLIGKPQNRQEAERMLMSLSDKTHKVITGVCIKTAQKQISFSELSHVTFGAIAKKEIKYYVKHYKPYDKAGAYGIQDWFGLRFIKHIEGCFYNVMGLPVNRIIAELKKMGIKV